MGTDIRVTRLGHVALGVADLSAAAEFYQDRWGLAVSDEGQGCLFMRADGPITMFSPWATVQASPCTTTAGRWPGATTSSGPPSASPT
jgi:catechol-2,3-dioxygenase